MTVTREHLAGLELALAELKIHRVNMGGVHPSASARLEGLIAKAKAAVAEPVHSTQDNYDHFLSYSGLADYPMLRYAYFHGADDGIDKPEPVQGEAVAVAECREVHGHMCQFLNRTQYGKDTLRDGDKLYTAPPSPDAEPVAVVEYTGYEPNNNLKWFNKGLAYMEPGTRLYTAPPSPADVSTTKDCLAVAEPDADLIAILIDAQMAVQDMQEALDDQGDWASAGAMVGLSDRIDAKLAELRHE